MVVGVVGGGGTQEEEWCRWMGLRGPSKVSLSSVKVMGVEEGWAVEVMESWEVMRSPTWILGVEKV